MSSTVQEIPAAVLEVLELPEHDRLTGDQVRGAECVCCTVRLTAEIAVDLGEHQTPLAGTASLRACRTCVASRAHEGLFTHASMCEQCTDEAGGCTVGRWLYRLVREWRR